MKEKLKKTQERIEEESRQMLSRILDCFGFNQEDNTEDNTKEPIQLTKEK